MKAGERELLNVCTACEQPAEIEDDYFVLSPLISVLLGRSFDAFACTSLEEVFKEVNYGKGD